MQLLKMCIRDRGHFVQVVGRLFLVVGQQTAGSTKRWMSGSFVAGIADIFFQDKSSHPIMPQWNWIALAAPALLVVYQQCRVYRAARGPLRRTARGENSRTVSAPAQSAPTWEGRARAMNASASRRPDFGRSRFRLCFPVSSTMSILSFWSMTIW